MDRAGRVLCFHVLPGQENESPHLPDLFSDWSVRRPGSGRPRSRPKRAVADKGYTGRKNRRFLRRRGIRVTIPRRSNERRRGPFDRETYRERNVVERAINRLKQFRGLATRYGWVSR